MIKTDSDNNIIYTHGDTFAVRFDLGERTIKNGDKAIFTLVLDGEFVLDATVEGSGQSLVDFVIDAETMKQIPAGRYLYDTHIKYADGCECTLDVARQCMVLSTTRYWGDMEGNYPIHYDVVSEIDGDYNVAYIKQKPNYILNLKPIGEVKVEDEDIKEVSRRTPIYFTEVT